MAVRFILGRAGSGKTQHIRSRIVEALRAAPIGRPIYLVLPKQATFSAERDLTCNSGLGGFTRARVLSFDMLAEEILAEVGGCAIPEVTTLGRQMLLGFLLRRNKDQLTFFRDVAHHPGLASRLDATFAELERTGQDRAALDQLVDQLERADLSDIGGDLLLRKMRDIRLLYTAYTRYVGQERLDPHGRLQQMLSIIDRAPSLKGAAVYVDGLLDVTQAELKMLSRIARVAETVEIALCLDPDSPVVGNVHTIPDDLSLFHRCEMTYRRLSFAFSEEGATVAPPLVLRTPMRGAAVPLHAVERAFGGDADAPQPNSDAVELIEAPTRRQEVDAAARRIRELLNAGHRLREVSVLVRDLDAYHELIDASFREHGLSYFADRRRAAMHHPLLQFVRAALQIVRQHWPHDAIMTLLKCGLCGLEREQVDELENYVLLHRIRGGAWADAEPWRFSQELMRDEEDDLPPAARMEAERIDGFRRSVVDKLRPFVNRSRTQEALPVRQIVTELFHLLDRFKVRQTLIAWMDIAELAGEYEQRDEHEQVWTQMVLLFDQMVDLMGEEAVDLDDFIEIVEAGLASFDLALTPPTLDQVLVGQVDRTRTVRTRTTILLGLNEGCFPRVGREDSILADSERHALKERGIGIDPDTERRLLDENLLAYIAFTRGHERLIVTRSTGSDDNKPLGASAFWERLARLFPDNPITRFSRDPEPDTLGTPRQLVSCLMDWVRDGAKADESAVQPMLYQWLATHDCRSDAIDTMRYRSWKALSYANEARLSQQIGRQLFKTPLNASVTRIETFATCPFKHYAIYGLKLRERDEPDVTALDLGNVYHHVLERVVREVLKNHADWSTIETEMTDEMIHRFAEEIGQSLRGELLLSSARNKSILRRIERTLSQVIAAQQAMMKRGAFRPLAAELQFGGADGRLPPLVLKTPRGHEVRLHGRIDRVDVVADTGDVAVIDYKLSQNRLALDRVYHGLALQLLTYLLVVQANAQSLAGRPLTPAAAFYVKLLRRLDKVDHPDQATAPDHPAFDLQVKPRGIFSAQCINHLDADLAGGASDVVAAYINRAGAFGYRDRNDHADAAEFQALLKYVERRIGQLSDQIVAGRVDIHPYRLGTVTPCPQCPCRAVCRFEPMINTYQHIQPMARGLVLDKVLEEAAHAQ